MVGRVQFRPGRRLRAAVRCLRRSWWSNRVARSHLVAHGGMGDWKSDPGVLSPFANQWNWSVVFPAKMPGRATRFQGTGWLSIRVPTRSPSTAFSILPSFLKLKIKIGISCSMQCVIAVLSMNRRF